MSEPRKPPIRVMAIFVPGRRAVLSDGREVPITNFVSATDNDADPEEAKAFVCGQRGEWFACRLSDFDASGRRH